MKKQLLIPAFCLLFTSTQVSAALSQDLNSSYALSALSEQQSEKMSELMAKHGGSFIRPESCPMNSKGYAEIAAKIQSIKSLFKDPSCLNDKTELQETFDSLVETGQGIESELNTAGAAQSTTLNDSQLNGAAINGLFSNINSLFFQSSCQVDDRKILEKGADFIQSFAQVGLLVPNGNGLVVSGGGLALSGILRLMNNLFTKKFDFESDSERQSFVKLNCAFYDIRRDIEKSGLVEIALNEHHEDYKQIDVLISEIDQQLKDNTRNFEEQNKAITQAEKEFVSQKESELLALQSIISPLHKILGTPVKASDDGAIPAETVKRNMFIKLVESRDVLIKELESYYTSGLSSAPFLDFDLRVELDKLNYEQNKNEFELLYRMSPEDFNKSYRASLLFHFGRIIEDIEERRGNLVKQWREETIIAGTTVNSYVKSLAKSRSAKEKSLNEAKKSLVPVKVRLGRIIGSDTGFTRADDGTENKTVILNSYDEISNQIYGKWGYEFLKYTTKTAKEEVEVFNQKFKSFADDHLEIEKRHYVIPGKDNLDDLTLLSACQNVKPNLRRYSSADALVQQAYDFVVTNKELFHSDHREAFLGDVTKVRNVFEKIKDHHISSVIAQRVLRNEEVSKAQKKRYLGEKAMRKGHLGTIMLATQKEKPKAQLLQKILNEYDCGRLTTLDD